MADDDDELRALREGCTRFLQGHGQETAAAMLATIPPDTRPDTYGEGGVVAELEQEVAGLLGKPAAVFVPSGVMGQQAVLRVHADRRGRRTVVFHPMCHLERHEEQAYQRLHGLIGRPAGNPSRLMTMDDLTEIAEAPAALLIELPQRDLGGQQPDWADLEAQVAWARDRGAAAHLDGARLWESAAGYQRRPAEIAALFDTVYVSFYKGLGGLGGCCVAGDRDVIDELSVWRTRHGGRVFMMWPYAASARTVLRERLPRMGQYARHAKAIGRALRDADGIEVLPDPPQSAMMHVRLELTLEQLRTRVLAIAKRDKVWTFARPFTSEGPRLQRFELSVGDATLELEPDEIRSLLERLVG
jgi:threonine aldolase